MRNAEFKDDMAVFSFINSKNCKTYSSLKDFLYKNNLPIRARWAFYYFGKFNWIDTKLISEMSCDCWDSYGGYIFGEIYYWEEYLNEEHEHKDNIKQEFMEEGKEATDEEIHKIYMKRGIDFVNDCEENDRDSEKYRYYQEYYEQMSSGSSYGYDGGSSFCEACQQSPCMCSDREQSSTLHDF